MEITAHESSSTRASRVRTNSFDCDASAMEAILGLSSVGERNVRLDFPHSVANTKGDAWVLSGHGNPSPPLPTTNKRSAEVHSPIDIVPTIHQDDSLRVELDKAIKRERLLRLLDQQQSWYDAQLKAASAAEQLLSLCEHHQQQWLLPNPQTL
jgi:hypothetical protein